MIMNSPPRIAPCQHSFSTRNGGQRRVIAMRLVRRAIRRATCARPALSEHRSLQIDIVDTLEKRDRQMIGNVDRGPRPVNFMVGSIDPPHVEPCGLMWDERCAQHGAQLAGWARQEVQPGHRCRGAALRGMPDRHGIRNRLHVSRPVSWLDARVSERRGMRACGYPLSPCGSMVVAGPLWEAHQ